MSDRSPRSIALAVMFGGTALLLMLGFVLWRTLPPLVPEAAHMAERSRPYEPVSHLPMVIEEADLEGIRYAILADPDNAQLRADGYYDREIATWRRWMADEGAIETGAGEADVLIVPFGECLEPDLRNQIALKLSAGGGVVSTGMLGSRDGICEPSTDTLVTRMLGLKATDIAVVEPRPNEALHAIILGESLMGARIPPGARIEIEPGLQYVFRTRNRDMYYTNYKREPRAYRDEPFFDGAATRALVGRGRYLALGFDLHTLGDDFSRRVMSNGLATSVRWTAGYPVAQIAPWPRGRKAAAVIALDVEADFHNARHTLEMIQRTKLPSTAFIVGALAEADDRTMEMLKIYREIATHTYDHLPLDTFSYAAQIRQLDRSKRATEMLAGQEVPGLRPPQERFNAETLEIWADLGGDYIFGANNMRIAAPEIIPMEPDSLVLLARTSEDDFEILERDKMRDRGVITSLLLSQVDEVVALRGLYMFSFHSHMFSQKDMVPIVEVLATKLMATPAIWTTTAGEVARWWRRRSYLDIAKRADGSLRVRNDGSTALDDVVVIIHKLDGTTDRLPIPVIQAGDSVIVPASRAGRFAPQGVGDPVR